MADVEFKKLANEMAGKQRGSSSILLLVVVTLVVIIVMWAAVTELDSVVRGSGKTVSEAQNQLVQSSEPGIIKKGISTKEILLHGAKYFLILILSMPNHSLSKFKKVRIPNNKNDSIKGGSSKY